MYRDFLVLLACALRLNYNFLLWLQIHLGLNQQTRKAIAQTPLLPAGLGISNTNWHNVSVYTSNPSLFFDCFCSRKFQRIEARSRNPGPLTQGLSMIKYSLLMTGWKIFIFLLFFNSLHHPLSLPASPYSSAGNASSTVPIYFKRWYIAHHFEDTTKTWSTKHWDF